MGIVSWASQNPKDMRFVHNFGRGLWFGRAMSPRKTPISAIGDID